MFRSTLFCILYFVFFLISCTYSQTKWFKYEGNPVLDVGTNGSWDDEFIHPDQVIFEQGVYRMWYMGFDGSYGRMGHATSPDGIHWIKDSLNPVLSPGAPGLWESKGAVHGYVTRGDSSYRMWYMGADDNFNYKIGIATSINGRAWTKEDSINPILGPGAWYNIGPTLPCITERFPFAEIRIMLFAGENTGHYLQIGRATSSNDIDWTVDENPVLTVGPAGSWEDRNVFGPRIIYRENFFENGLNGFEMWYGGERSDFKSHFGYAVSIDGGITWTKNPENPVFKRGPASWESNDLAFPVVYFDGQLYHMWYSGNDGDTWRGGYAISPRGLDYNITTNYDSIRIEVSKPFPYGFDEPIYSFSAEIKEGSLPIDTLILYDDGLHGDSLNNDAVFANTWVSPTSRTYNIDLKLILVSQADIQKFEMYNAGNVTTVTDLNEHDIKTPGEFSLAQNYPNPFNNSTMIRYQLPKNSHLKLYVYNLLGEKIASLVDEYKVAGTYTVTWDATGFASGVYVYKLKAGDYVDSKKLLLLK